MDYGLKKLLEGDLEYFTVRSLAEILGLDCSTIRKDIRNKRLIAKKVLRCYLIKPSDAINYLKKFD